MRCWVGPRSAQPPFKAATLHSVGCPALQLVFNKGGKRIIQIVYLDDRVR